MTAVGLPGSRRAATVVADCCQHTTQRLAEVGTRMSVVRDKLGLTRPAASISDCRPSARPRFWPKNPRPPEVAYYLLDFGRRTVFARLTPARKRPPGRQPDVVCLSIAAEPCRAIAVLGADLPLPDRDP
jgi:hypothetical protein